MRKKALYITDRLDEIYSPALQLRVEMLVDLVAPPQSSDIAKRAPELLHDVEIILSGWGPPVLDRDFLSAAPRLEAFFYAAGCIQYPVTSAVWDRKITVCSSVYVNSIPVAEYTLAQILLALKHTCQAADEYRQKRAKVYSLSEVSGAYGGIVGLIGLGNVSRILMDLLRPFDIQVLACDPKLGEDEIRSLGAESRSMEEIFAMSDVVSLHASNIPSTRGMITGSLLRSMKTGSTFINTSRGSLVREDDLADVMLSRPDLLAILDVTDPEPPLPSSPLWTVPNIHLTPHIAGSQGRERFRVGKAMVDDLERYLNGKPLKWQVQPPGSNR
ncbi:MAG: hydroxyacid dehydrogenase [Kiritimatiellales bacterium]